MFTHVQCCDIVPSLVSSFGESLDTGLYFAPQLPRGFDHFYGAGRGGEPPPPHSAGRGVHPCPKPVKSTKVKLLPNEDGQVKGTLPLRALCTQFLQIHGFCLKDRKKKYGVGPCPPGWPSTLNWSNFKGPGKHSVGMCEEIIHAMKVHQSQQGAVGGGQPQQVADHGLGDLGYDDLANLVDRAEVVLQLQEEGGEEVGEQVDEVA